ncbi:hypothetical protein HHL01_06555 [Pseudoalteromonas arctica]|uniref:Uncharacterized protein n=1 Tax=Pseudoalteromonas arctica TaxID=394751 RepID=A0A7X9U5G4_9GAMM|nr:hypothetical protein [Pseudoalteromonas arctica]NMF47838.1 hypothetical protein [Pseudoalteromonas arctica]
MVTIYSYSEFITQISTAALSLKQSYNVKNTTDRLSLKAGFSKVPEANIGNAAITCSPRTFTY